MPSIEKQDNGSSRPRSRHKTVSDDELLRRYANLPWDNLYEAQQRAEKELAGVIDAAGPDPFGARPKTYIGIEKTKAIFDLDADGFSPVQIAEKLGITSMTVYRHLESKFGKRQQRQTMMNDGSVSQETKLESTGQLVSPASPQLTGNIQVSKTDLVAG